MLKKLLFISFISLGIMILSFQQAHAQNTAVITSTSYDPPMLPEGAPGQLVTFSISGIGRQLTSSLIADRFPLPTVLGGISIELDFEGNLIPLLSVEPRLSMERVNEGFVLVTAQIPYETGLEPRFHFVSVIEAGRVVYSTRFNLVRNKIHVLRTCDTLLSQRAGTCDTSLVFHLNGSLVTKENPAKAGEHLVMYAVGLGRPDSLVKSGEPAPGLATVTRLRMDFVFAVNTLPRDIRRFDDAVLTRPDFAGLVPGLVGLYQINFQAPSFPSTLPKCDEVNRSNLTITIGLPPTAQGAGSFDGVGICVTP
jgi:uncharacterized protein (TIGR03437 family)